MIPEVNLITGVIRQAVNDVVLGDSKINTKSGRMKHVNYVSARNYLYNTSGLFTTVMMFKLDSFLNVTRIRDEAQRSKSVLYHFAKRKIQ